MLRIGCHLSSSKGFLSMAKEAASIDAGTFQFFTRNPREAVKVKNGRQKILMNILNLLRIMIFQEYLHMLRIHLTLVLRMRI